MQVEEVLSKNYSRLSINGWFHAADVPKFDMPVYVTPKNGLFSDNRIEAVDVDSEIQTWIKQNYLQNHVTVQIQKHIEEYSEISLEDFFIESRFQEILTNLDSPGWYINFYAIYVNFFLTTSICNAVIHLQGQVAKITTFRNVL